MESSTQIHIIYTEAEMLLSRQVFASWREIQDAYETYKASLGPWSADEVVEYLEDEYRDLSPAARVQMGSFLASGAETHVLTFYRA
jgi:hypothetical protein